MGNRFQHFGEALRYYRESYQDRVGPNNPDMLRIRMTDPALRECMARKGCFTSSGAYSEIEQGTRIPRDPRTFLEAVAKCLAIVEGSPEWRTLVQQLGYDIFAAQAGPWVRAHLP
jgi:hypothetical protein